MPPDVASNFSPTRRVAHVDCILQVKLFREGGKIVRIGVHVIAIPGLSGSAVTAPVGRDDSKALLTEVQHLSIPVVRGERPAVAEHYGLSLAPVFVENLRTVFGGDRRHKVFSSAAILGCDS